MAISEVFAQRRAERERLADPKAIDASSVIAIGNKADLLLSGSGVRHGKVSSGNYFNLGFRRSLEIIRQIDTVGEEKIRYYNIYYTRPEGIVHYRSVGEEATIKTTLSGSHTATLRERIALVQLLRTVQQRHEKQIRKDRESAASHIIFKSRDQSTQTQNDIALAA